MNIKVSEYRDSTDHLFRLVNVDYHACVDARELRHWQERTKRVFSKVEALECKRATERDRDQHRRVLEAARTRLAQSEDRIKYIDLERSGVVDLIH